jgi:hypothetical protein
MSPRARRASPSRTGDFGFGVQVGSAGRRRKSLTISVESELTRLGLPGFVLRSSDRKAPLVSGKRWPPGVLWSIEDRLRSEGARKGRVLAVWQGDQVVAVCAWHLHESGPPVIFDVACRVDLEKPLAERAANALLLCLRQIAGASGVNRDTSTLRWAERPLDRIANREERNRARHAVRARAEALEFNMLRPRPKWVDKGWAAQRQFPNPDQKASA